MQDGGGGGACPVAKQPPGSLWPTPKFLFSLLLLAKEFSLDTFAKPIPPLFQLQHWCVIVCLLACGDGVLVVVVMMVIKEKGTSPG